MSAKSFSGNTAVLRAGILLSLLLLAASGAAQAACKGAGAPTDTQTKCLTAIAIPGKPLASFDISWVSPERDEYYLSDRSNAGIDVIDTRTLTFKRTIPGFVGVTLNANGAVNNNVSGPDGVTAHGRWLYAGDGNSTLHVIDLEAPPAAATRQVINTGGTTRVDEMALTTDGTMLFAANNAQDPPYGTLFNANGDRGTSAVTMASHVTIDPTIVPPGFGLSIEQSAWEPRSARFYVSIPVIANNPTGCNYGQLGGPITCHGGMAVIDPVTLPATAVIGAFDPSTNTGVVPLSACGPNGISVGPHGDMVMGCTPQNNPADTTTLVINAKTKHFVNVGGITGSDEVWFNAGDERFYTGSSRACGAAAGCPAGGAALGVINARTNLLIETIPQSFNSHSVAADAQTNRIFVPQVAPVATVGTGGDTTTVGADICGGASGCIAVYVHDADRDRDHDDDDDDHNGGRW